jgi:hypothetical protein
MFLFTKDSSPRGVDGGFGFGSIAETENNNPE